MEIILRKTLLKYGVPYIEKFISAQQKKKIMLKYHFHYLVNIKLTYFQNPVLNQMQDLHVRS